jgi:hypothetical protein
LRLAWHPDGTISAHPLVRDTFRPLALQAAAAAADTSLTGLPKGRVTSRADAVRVAEAIELLLDAGQWHPANGLYQSRSLLFQGRDDADAARRMAIHHRLPWHELGALTAHAALDEAEGTSHGWAAQARQLQAQLVPPGLDPDPLATVERVVEAEKPGVDEADDSDAGVDR